MQKRAAVGKGILICVHPLRREGACRPYDSSGVLWSVSAETRAGVQRMLAWWRGHSRALCRQSKGWVNSLGAKPSVPPPRAGCAEPDESAEKEECSRCAHPDEQDGPSVDGVRCPVALATTRNVER